MRQIYFHLVEPFGDTPLQVLSMRHAPSVLNQTTWMNLCSSTNHLQEFLTITFEVLKHFFEATRGHPSCYLLPNNFEWRVLEAENTWLHFLCKLHLTSAMLKEEFVLSEKSSAINSSPLLRSCMMNAFFSPFNPADCLPTYQRLICLWSSCHLNCQNWSHFSIPCLQQQHDQ